MLNAAGFKLPNTVRIHGFLTVDGEKMSKSKGTFVNARTYFKHLPPHYLRYYYASKLTNKVDDIDMNLDEFVSKINSDLVGKVVNLASRTAKFISGKTLVADEALCPALAKARSIKESVAALYEEGNYAAAMREIMAAADAANEFIEAEKPWTLAKDPDQAERLHAVCSNGLLTFWELVLMLGPCLPTLLADVCKLFGQSDPKWDSDISGATVGKFEHLMKRVDAKAVKAMVEETASSHSETAQADSAQPAQPSLENKAWDGEECADHPIRRLHEGRLAGGRGPGCRGDQGLEQIVETHRRPRR